MTYALAHRGLIAVLLAQHVALVLIALTIAVAIAFPLAVLARGNPRLRAFALSAFATLYTVPSLAILALLVRWFGLGAPTAIVALVLYAQFALVRAFVSAFAALPSAAIESATAMGMTPAQRFLRVEIPLAAPILVAGLRVTTVALVSLATLAAFAGAGGMGTLIFQGLSREYPAQTLSGSVPAAALALILDGALRALERRFAYR